MNTPGLDRSIVVVDDDPSILKVLNRQLRDAGFSVSVVQDAAKAISEIRAIRPDLVLLDVRMPEIDGYEICRMLRENEDTASIKILFLSAKARKQDVDRGLRTGADGYIVKPCSAQHLLSRISELLSVER